MCADGQLYNQNMSLYAKTNVIRLYFIYIGPSDADTDVQTALQNMADTTGGKVIRASDATALAGAYNTIAGDLITEAGVNTVVSADFGSVIVNNAVTGNVFNYVGDPVLTTVPPTAPTTFPGSICSTDIAKTPMVQSKRTSFRDPTKQEFRSHKSVQ